MKKPLSEFQAAYKPLYEGSRMSTFLKGKQFVVYGPGEYRAGFITQHSERHFVAHIDNKMHSYYNSVDFRRFLAGPGWVGYTFGDTLNAG